MLFLYESYIKRFSSKGKTCNGKQYLGKMTEIRRNISIKMYRKRNTVLGVILINQEVVIL